MWRQLVEIRSSSRGWHMPVLAGLSVGIPLLGGYALGHLSEGRLAALAGLVMLYLPEGSFAQRMTTLMACSLGIMASFTIGALFSFSPWAGCLALAVWAFLVHLSMYYFRLFRPPGNFFFIMIASVALCMPFAPAAIFTKIGLVASGTMVSCALALIYCVLKRRRGAGTALRVRSRKSRQAHVREAVVFGVFAGLSLLVAVLLRFQNPYWVPTSCMAVMQGLSARHIWQRGLQRIGGTLIGLVLTWGVLLLEPSSLALCLGIVVIQVIVELLIVRNYGLAVVFLTVMTIFLAEPTEALGRSPGAFIQARAIDIITGSLIGIAGGWALFSERLRRAGSASRTPGDL